MGDYCSRGGGMSLAVLKFLGTPKLISLDPSHDAQLQEMNKTIHLVMCSEIWGVWSSGTFLLGFKSVYLYILLYKFKKPLLISDSHNIISFQV